MTREEEPMKYLYGIQPTGRIHIGNYLGGLKLAIEKSATILVAQLHSMTSEKYGIPYSEDDMIADLKRLGAKNVKLQNPKVLLSAWQIQCITPVSELERMTQWKAKGKGNSGLLTYPCLMAADILNEHPDFVIVGEDQMQHMELYRRTHKRLLVGRKPAEALLTETPRIMSIKDPTKKMSKSLGDEHCLYLGDHEANRKKVMKAPTTPSGIKNLKQIADGLEVNFSPAKAKEGKQNIIKALSNL